MSGPPTLRKSTFANIDARMRCPTADCWGDLLLMPPYIRRWYTGLFMGTRGADED